MIDRIYLLSPQIQHILKNINTFQNYPDKNELYAYIGIYYLVCSIWQYIELLTTTTTITKDDLEIKKARSTSNLTEIEHKSSSSSSIATNTFILPILSNCINNLPNYQHILLLNEDVYKWLLLCQHITNDVDVINCRQKIQVYIGKQRLLLHEECQKRIVSFKQLIQRHIKKKDHVVDHSIADDLYINHIHHIFINKQIENKQQIIATKRRNNQDNYTRIKILLSYLNNDRSPWSYRFYPFQQKDTSHKKYYKLSLSENQSRMHLLLIHDEHGTNHENAINDNHKVTTLINNVKKSSSSFKDNKLLRMTLPFTKSIMIDNKTPALEFDNDEIIANTNDDDLESEHIFYNTTMIRIDYVMPGKLYITTNYLYFDADLKLAKLDKRNKLVKLDQHEATYAKKYEWNTIQAIHYRRYNLLPCGIELMFSTGNICTFLS